MFFKSIISRYESIGIKIDGSKDRAIAIKTFNWILLLTFVAGSVWSLLLWFMGQYQAVVFPALAAFCIPFILLYFNKTKNFAIPVDSFLVLMLTLPSFLQTFHGGFVNSGAVVSWAVVAPMTALAFKTAIQAKRCFLIFIGVVLLTVAVEVYVPREFVEMSKEIILLQFTINLIGIIAVCFFPLLNFSEQLMQTRKLLRVKNKEVLDSIYYAKNIQSAVLQGKQKLKDIIGVGSFIMYEPKDIVSGDFYWAHRDGDNLYLACGDCTGHGVPGAFMTMMGINHLNSIIKELKGKSTSSILKRLHEKVIGTLRDANNDGLHDGMDITICRINFKDQEIEYASAMSTVYFFNGEEVKKFPNDKFSVGDSRREVESTSRIIKFKKGDCLYLLTDGYIDQFGGPKARKFGSRNVREMLTKVAGFPIEEQHEVIEKSYRQWKGLEEQIDDIAFVGVRF